MNTFKKAYDMMNQQEVISEQAANIFNGNPDTMGEATVRPYPNSRFFGVYVNEDELICICVYRKGAHAVANLLNTLHRRMDVLSQTNVISPAA